jgi:hypothetical protein
MNSKMKLTNVRLSFPSVFKKAFFDGKETKFEATLLMDKDDQADQIKKVNDMVDEFLLDKFGKGKVPKGIKRTVLIDGDEKDYDGYENQTAMKAGSTSRVTLIDRDKTPILEEDNVLYAGCYVNAIVSLWYSDHAKGGKQVLGNLHGIQFVRDGESFGADTAASVDEFDEVEGEDEDF